jgi:hypothetical protein
VQVYATVCKGVSVGQTTSYRTNSLASISGLWIVFRKCRRGDDAQIYASKLMRLQAILNRPIPCMALISEQHEDDLGSHSRRD